MNAILSSEWNTVIAALGGAIITAIVTLLVARGRARIDVQAALNTGFQALVTELQEERGELTRVIKEQSETIEDLERKVLSVRQDVLDEYDEERASLIQIIREMHSKVG